MATEAHKLIGISLSKIAQSRASRSGVSLHKNLLVATVLHKARYIFMEEAYHLVHGNTKSLKSSNERYSCHQVDLNETKSVVQTTSKNYEDEWNISDLQNKHLEKELENDVIECQQSYKLSPPSYQAHIELTYLNLDESSTDCEQSSQKFSDSKVMLESQENNTLKRRHSEWEIEEAVLSILPKRTKSQSENDESPLSESNDDFVFLNDPAFLSDNERLITPLIPAEHNEPSMEIDRLSSLVSFFSFTTNLASESSSDDISCKSQSTISVPNSDLCSAQAKETNEVLQPPIQYLAMTV